MLYELLDEMTVHKVSLLVSGLPERISFELLLCFQALYICRLDKRNLDMLDLAVLRNHRAVHGSKYLRISYEQENEKCEMVFDQGLQVWRGEPVKPWQKYLIIHHSYKLIFCKTHFAALQPHYNRVQLDKQSHPSSKKFGLCIRGQYSILAINTR